MVIDECGRFWFPSACNTILIYSHEGNLLGNYTIPNMAVACMIITDNYVIYMSDWINNQMVRVDPNIEC